MNLSRVDLVEQSHEHERVEYHGEMLSRFEVGWFIRYAVVHVK